MEQLLSTLQRAFTTQETVPLSLFLSPGYRGRKLPLQHAIFQSGRFGISGSVGCRESPLSFAMVVGWDRYRTASLLLPTDVSKARGRSTHPGEASCGLWSVSRHLFESRLRKGTDTSRGGISTNLNR